MADADQEAIQFPEHWIPLLGKHIPNVHLKEYSKAGNDFTIESFRPLLDGTTKISPWKPSGSPEGRFGRIS